MLVLGSLQPAATFWGKKERIEKELGSAVAFEYILHVFVRLRDRKAFVLRWHIERVVS